MTAMIVPTPTRLLVRAGGFRLLPSTTLQAPGPAFGAAELLRGLLFPATGLLLAEVEPVPDAGCAVGGIRLTLDPARAELGPEGYQLTVTDDCVVAVAAEIGGLRWAVQTMRQLLPVQVYSAHLVADVDWVMPAVDVLDVPRFAWRGVMIDLARWFRPPAEIRRLIELAALHKLNVVHLHLTDDQGWRFESQKYPSLTAVGAWRAESMIGPANDDTFDGNPHGGYYTQAELRELVSLATRLGVTLVPEIDLPGHMTAAIAAYPELGNDTGRQLAVGTRWGIIKEVLNVEDSTVEFVTDVLDEVLDVFPSQYIHVGGDECPRTEWAAAPRAQQRKRELGLATDDELEAWFIAQVHRHLSARGRTMVGWDEILDGGPAPGATVMAWQGEHRGISAAQFGHDVVMAPEDRLYLDHYQGDPGVEPWAPRGRNTLEGILAYQPIAPVLTSEQAAHVLGAQCNVWTEYIPTREHLDYMVFPRLCAFAEMAWGSPGRDPAQFLNRLPAHLARLDVLGVDYRPLDGSAAG